MRIEEIEQKGKTQLEIARRMRELIQLVEATFPGNSVYIGPSESAVSSNARNGSETSSRHTSRLAVPMKDQIASVLRDNGGKMQKTAIFQEIQKKGGTMSFETLSAYLTRHGCFQKLGGGMWRIVE